MNTDGLEDLAEFLYTEFEGDINFGESPALMAIRLLNKQMGK